MRILHDCDAGDIDASEALAAMSQVQIAAQRTKLPNRLGSGLARDIFERTLGEAKMLNPHEEYVYHHEEPARNVVSTGAAASSNSEVLGEVNTNEDNSIKDGGQAPVVGTSQVASTRSTDALAPVYILEFARSPKAFLDAITVAPELQLCREALENAGCDWVLESGAKAFVYPNQYEVVVAAVRSLKLKPRHVIVSADYERKLHDAISNVGQGVVEKSRDLLTPAAIVSRTFIEVPVVSSLRSAPFGPAVVSTTDANPRAKFQPRRR
mmetsp:Transcript_88892/g.163028  ORF Transcript_88892/g.163028 Transcript_88892/m.163028 type:complete len:267 (-) Transcript_88892:311-1111(-)